MANNTSKSSVSGKSTDKVTVGSVESTTASAINPERPLASVGETLNSSTKKDVKEAVSGSTAAATDRAREVAQDVIEKAREGYETGRQKLYAVSDEIGKKYEKISDEMRRKAEDASQVARERYAETSDVVRARYGTMRKDMDSLATDVNAYVKDNPAKAVLMAAGAGFLLGLVMRGRNSGE